MKKNMVAMKRILRNFELLPELKINYNKCSVAGINVNRDRLESFESSLGCVIGYIPLSYLGLKWVFVRKMFGVEGLD